MAFQYVPIKIVEGDDGASLIEEYAKLVKICEESGDVEHGHTIVAQIFAHKNSDRKFFISGRVLNEEESLAFAKILGTQMKRVEVEDAEARMEAQMLHGTEG